MTKATFTPVCLCMNDNVKWIRVPVLFLAIYKWVFWDQDIETDIKIVVYKAVVISMLLYESNI